MNKKQLKADVREDHGGDLVAKITTESIDRDGEVLVPQGMNSKDYDNNPVLFWNHDYAKRPEGFEGDFFPAFAETLVRQGIVRGVSVGFLPENNGMRNATKGDRAKYGPSVKRVFNKWKLLEVSLAPLPANQDALVQAVGKGLVDGILVKKFLGVDCPNQKIVLNTPRKRYALNLTDSSDAREQAEIQMTVRAEVARHTGQIYY